MQIKKSPAGTKFINIMTATPFPFLIYVVLGLGCLVSLALMTELDVIKTYRATLDETSSCLVIADCKQIDVKKVFVYENRNESVADTPVREARMNGADCIVLVDTVTFEKIKKIKGKLFVDIPVAKENLLHRLFEKGGVTNE